jgi:hypothetical protein
MDAAHLVKIISAPIDKLAGLLKVYTVYDKDGQIMLLRLGKNNDGGYIVPLNALKRADALLGYGIEKDASFEEDFSKNYHKPSYGFDCGVKYIGKHKLFHFINECINTDETLKCGQKSTKKITTFKQQLTRLGLIGKKIFIKMDIEGAEYGALPDILKYDADITGMVFELHLFNLKYVARAVGLLARLDNDFLLLHVHGNNYCNKCFVSRKAIGKIPGVVELTYINKMLVTKYNLSVNQAHPSIIDMPNNPAKKDINFEIIAK